MSFYFINLPINYQSTTYLLGTYLVLHIKYLSTMYLFINYLLTTHRQLPVFNSNNKGYGTHA